VDIADDLFYWKSNWWVLTLRGVLAILFGIACVFWPGLSLITFVYLFGVYILISGLVMLYQGIIAISRHKAWVLTLILGVLQIAVGVYLLRHPNVSFTALILLVAFSFIFIGVLEIVAVLSDDRATAITKTLLIISGALAIVAGIFMLYQPAAGGVAFVWIIGLYALLSGPLWIALSVDIKNLTNNLVSGKHKLL